MNEITSTAHYLSFLSSPRCYRHISIYVFRSDLSRPSLESIFHLFVGEINSTQFCGPKHLAGERERSPKNSVKDKTLIVTTVAHWFAASNISHSSSPWCLSLLMLMLSSPPPSYLTCRFSLFDVRGRVQSGMRRCVARERCWCSLLTLSIVLDVPR